MKIIIEIECEPDGPVPVEKLASLIELHGILTKSQYIGSESLDGTDLWGICVLTNTVTVK